MLCAMIFRDDAPVPMPMMQPSNLSLSLNNSVLCHASHASILLLVPFSINIKFLSSPCRCRLKKPVPKQGSQQQPADLHLSIDSYSFARSPSNNHHLNTNNRLRPLAPRPRLKRSHRIDDNDKQEGDPEEEPKSRSSLDAAAKGVGAAARRPVTDGQGDRSGEPEDHGDPLQRERDGALEHLGEIGREQGDVDEHEQRPD